MSTVRELIADALAEIGVYGVGASVSAEDSAFALRKLNDILSAWSNSPLSVWVETEVNIPLTGAMTYTVGPTGGVVTSRPIRVSGATCVSSDGVEYPVEMVTRRQWDAISIKAIGGAPVNRAWHEATLPNATIRVYPQAPSGYTLKLDTLKPLTAFASVNDTVVLPEGYETALTLALAEALAPSFRAQLSPVTLKRLNGAKAQIRRVNAEPLFLGPERGDEFIYERGY